MTHDRLPFARPDIDQATIDAVGEVLRSGWLASGPMVKKFERELSDYLGGRAVRALTSATEALEIALQAAGVEPGDEVITSAMSFCATANMIVNLVLLTVEPRLSVRRVLCAKLDAREANFQS